MFVNQLCKFACQRFEKIYRSDDEKTWNKFILVGLFLYLKN